MPWPNTKVKPVEVMPAMTNPGGFYPIRVNPEKADAVEFRPEKGKPLKLVGEKPEEIPAPGPSKVKLRH